MVLFGIGPQSFEPDEEHLDTLRRDVQRMDPSCLSGFQRTGLHPKHVK